MSSVLFYLDGTLVDTSAGIIKGIENVEKILNLTPKPYDLKKSFIGPPLFDSFIKYYNLKDSDAKEAVHLFRNYYSEKGKYECELYPGIYELLFKLKSNKIHTYVATSKPTVFAIDIISHFGMMNLFSDVVGSNLDNSRSKKNEIISYILDKYASRKEDTIMIGDKQQDIEGARLAGINSIGVTYGFGSLDEIIGSDPFMTASSVDEIDTCLQKLGWW